MAGAVVKLNSFLTSALGRNEFMSLTLWLLYPLGKTPQYLLDKRLGELQSQYGDGGKEKHPCPWQGLNPIISL
jgi:hypothetical protein